MYNERNNLVSNTQQSDRSVSDNNSTMRVPSISLPKGGGAIRGIGEKFAANPVTGSGSMSVPLPITPGRSGFTPQLSLSYDSGAGNGPFGFGWNLALPSISRKTDKGLARFIVVLRRLLPYLRTTLSERIVIQRLGDYLQLDAKAASDLLTVWANSPAHPAQKTISEFLAPSFTESNANVEVNREAFPDQFKTFLLPYKIALLSLKFRLTGAQMRWLFEFGSDNGWLDLNTLPLSTIGAAHVLYQGWARLADLFELRDAFPVGETLLSEVFTSAHDNTQLDALLDKISKGSGWKLENLQALSGENGFDFAASAFKDEVALRRLRAAFTMLNLLGASAGQCLDWTRSTMTETDELNAAREINWKLQERLANKELEQIEKQIAAAEIRKAIAEKDLGNHDLQVQNTTEVDEFMRSKFTNRELYDWMVGQISGIYFQSYQLAYDVAKRAERAYRYELGLRESSFIQFGYWDSLKKGLLAGERLSYDLKRMEVAYLDQNKREYEIVKHISLLSIDPVSLVKLKQSGECFVTLPETLFDVDYAGHYMRRIKSVGITVPAVAGPYSGINCTLTLQSSTIRHANTLASGGKYGRQADDPRFVDSAGTVQSIVTSGAQNDSGLFETNLRDERYLPFEGQGAISTWRIEMPKNFKSFDYNTISDVVLHLRYTAREGGAQLRTQAEQELQSALNDFVRVEGKRGLAQMFSLRHEFSTEWARFLNAPSGTTQSLTMPMTKERFPFLFQGKTISIKTVELYVKVKVKPEFEDHNTETIKIALAAGATAPVPPSSDTLVLDLWNGLVRGSKVFNNAPLGTFTLNAWRKESDPLNPDAIQDILVVCRYTVS